MVHPPPLWAVSILMLGLAVPTDAASQDPCALLEEEAGRIAALRDSDAEAGIEAAQDGVARARAAGCIAARAEMLGALGDNLNVAGRHTEAIRAYRDGQALLGPLGASAALASLLRREGIAHSSEGDLPRAVERTLESLRMADTLGEPGEAAMAASNLGILHSRLSEFDRARDYLERAHAGFLEAGNRVSAAGTGVNLGSLLLRQADRLEAQDHRDAEARALREEARRLNLAAMEEFEGLGHPRGTAMAASNAGVAAGLLGDHETALGLHRRALAIREEVGDREGRAASHLHRAMAGIPLGLHAEAEADLRAAEALTPESGLTTRLGIVEQWVALEDARGRPAEALARLREANRIREVMVAADQHARVAEIQARFDHAQQSRELEQLRHERELGELMVARQRSLLLGGGTAVLLLLALLLAMVAWHRQSRRYARALEQLARTDELTGLPNRREARDRIEYELARAERTGRPFSLALIDIDGFKAVNDDHGHDTGDRVLIAVTRWIRRHPRGQDSLARWGGDEFLILLPDTDEDGALVATDKLAHGLRENPVDVDGTLFPITLSVGVFECHGARSVDACVRWADEAMYETKRGRKDQLEIGLADTV
jgi:diguanylate cyclase (GGDEF)-like protein